MQENQLKPQPLSGREREGGAFLRKAASLAYPPKLEPQLLFGREREGGASLREAASLAYALFLFFVLLQSNAGFFEDS